MPKKTLHSEQAEDLARAGRCTWEGHRCMTEVDGGVMGTLGIEMPDWMCGQAKRVEHAGPRPRLERHRRHRDGLWDMVGHDARGVERYRVSGYESEDEARATLEWS